MDCPRTLFVLLFYFVVVRYRILSEEFWRYSTKSGDAKYELTTREPIKVEHFGTQTTHWCHSHGCTVNETSSPVTFLKCEEQGYHAVSPNGNSTMLRHMKVTLSPFCYKWYYWLEKSATSSGFSGRVRLWVIDYLHASKDELNKDAALPSLFSSELTSVFASMGQEPQVRLTAGDRYIEQALQYHNRSFNDNTSYWEYNGLLFTHHTVLWINSKSVAFYDCFVGAQRIQLMGTKSGLSTSVDGGKLQLQGNQQNPRIIHDPCAPNIAVRLGRGGLLLTQDNFRSTSRIYVPSTVLQGNAPVVRDAMFTSHFLVILLESGSLLALSSMTPDKITQPTGLTGSGITRLSKQTKCFKGEETELPPNLVIAWSNQGSDGRAFICNTNMTSFVELVIPWPASGLNWFIHDVVIHSFFPSAFFLVTPLTLQPKILEYDYSRQSWKEHAITFAFFGADSISLVFLPDDTHNLLLWNSTFLYYGRLNGDVSGTLLMVRQGNTSAPLCSANESISFIATGSEEFTVLLSTNKMFYGRTGIDYLVQIYPGESSSTDLSVMFDLLGGLLLVKNDSSGDNLIRRYLPLKNEVMSAVYPAVRCPYIKLASNVSHELRYVEKQHSITVWVSLIFRQQIHYDIEHQVFGSQLLDITPTKTVEYYPGKIKVNKTFTLKQKSVNQTSSSYSSGAASVRFFPSKVGMTCESPSQQTILIHLGCSPRLHLRIRNCSFPLEVRGNVLFFKDSAQCRLSVGVDDLFVVTIDLYEGERFISEVTHDYVLRENNGQKGFGYTATMAQAGCIREAQTWATINGSWSQDNYQSCFKNDGTSTMDFDGQQPYEIINSTGVSHVMFTEAGQYDLTLSVVDPHLSFCLLSARFIVEVSPGDGKKDVLPELISMVVVVTVSTVLLCISFLLYRNKTLGEHEQDRQLAERLQQLRSIYKGARQSIAMETPLGQEVRRSTVGGMRHSIRRATGTAELLALGPKRSSKVTEPSTENVMRPARTIEEELEPDDTDAAVDTKQTT